MAWCAWSAMSGISVALSSVISMDTSPGLCLTSWRHWRKGLEWLSSGSSHQRKRSLIWAKLRYYNVPYHAERSEAHLDAEETLRCAQGAGMPPFAGHPPHISHCNI